MALNKKYGTFTIVTGTGNKTYSSLWTFQPTFLLVWTTYRTAAGVGDGAIFAIGMCDGTRERACSTVSDDALGTSDTHRRKSNQALLSILTDATSPTLGFEANFVSWSSSDLTINQTTNASGTDVIVHYLALGGDLANVRVDTFTANTTTGTQDITSPAFDMTTGKACVIFIWSSGTSSTFANVAHGGIGIGFMVDASREGGISLAHEDNRAAPDNWRFQRNNAGLVGLTPGSGAVDGIAEFSSWLSSGFRINWTDAPAAADTIYFAALEGVTFDGGDFAITSGTGNQDVTTSIDPEVLLLLTDQSSTNNPASAESHAALCVGANDGSAEGCTDLVDEDAPASSNVENLTSLSTTKILNIYATDVNATGSSTTLDLDADATLGTAKFTINKTTNTGSQLARVLWLAARTPSAVTQPGWYSSKGGWW
jgi:hypothetical protein